MNCENCNVSYSDKMLHRTKPKGQPDGGWMCIDCINSSEPELGDNIIKDDSYPLMQDIEDICTGDS